jgi:hypothetical protein
MQPVTATLHGIVIRRIPRQFLHLTLEDLPEPSRATLLPLIADLPLVPSAAHSCQIVGPTDRTLRCLVVLARHVVQGLRDYNLTLAHDRHRLHQERRKLLFYDEPALLEAPCSSLTEAILCLVDPSPASVPFLTSRHATNLATFIATSHPLPQLPTWRQIHLV